MPDKMFQFMCFLEKQALQRIRATLPEEHATLPCGALIIQSVDAANAPPPTTLDAPAVIFKKETGRHSRRPPPQKKRKNVRRKLKRKAVRAATNAEQLGEPADAPEEEEAPDDDGHDSPTTEYYCVICQLELSGGEAYTEHLLEKSHVNCEEGSRCRPRI